MNAEIAPLESLLVDAVKSLAKAELQNSPQGINNFVLMRVEKPLYEAVLVYTNGNQTKAAKVLGINRGTFRSKMKKHSLL